MCRYDGQNGDCDIVTGHDGHVDYCNRLTCIMFNVVAHMWMVRYGLFWL